MSEHTEEYLDICAALAAGSADAKDRQQLAEHIAEGCLDCEVALADFEQATLLLAASAPAAMPNPALKERILAAVKEQRPAERPAAAAAPGKVVRLRPRPLAMTPQAWTALAAGLAVTTVIATWIAISMNGEANRLRGELADNAKVITVLNQQLELEKRWSDVLSSPEARFSVLSATPQADVVLRARATYDPKSRSAVFVFENLRAPQGKVFELWAILGTTPASLGLITTDEMGRAVVRVDDAGDPNKLVAFAVSLEKPGGSPNPNQPSGPVVMMGKVGG